MAGRTRRRQDYEGLGEESWTAEWLERGRAALRSLHRTALRIHRYIQHSTQPWTTLFLWGTFFQLMLDFHK